MKWNGPARALVLASLLILLTGCSLWQSPEIAARNYARDKVAKEGYFGQSCADPIVLSGECTVVKGGKNAYVSVEFICPRPVGSNRMVVLVEKRGFSWRATGAF